MPTMNGKIATSNSGNVENAHWKHLEGALGCIGMFFSFWVKGGTKGCWEKTPPVLRNM